MEYKSFDQLFKELKNKQYKPVYIFHGEEPYYIDILTKYIEKNVLPEAEQSFNQDILYGIEIDANKVLDYARQFPMMSERRVVIVKEAKLMKDELKKLETYVTNPAPHTILVISHPNSKVNGKWKFLTNVKKLDHCAVFLSDPIKEWKVADWIAAYLKKEKLQAEPDAVQLIAQYIGTDLKKIVNEIEKLKINLPTGTTITADHVADNIGISKEYNVFELIRAISMRDIPKMQMIANNMADNAKTEPLVKLLPAIATWTEKVMVVHQHGRLSDGALAGKAGIWGNQLGEYRTAARNYSDAGLKTIYNMITQWDGRIKGVGHRRGEAGLLQELIGVISVTR